MLRAENCIAGTTTTGTGTLTLAACPRPPGGTDFYAAFSSQGFTGSLLVSYCIIEYTDGTFLTAKQQEKGVGTLGLGASIAGTTLARTTVQQTSTGMDTATPSYNTRSPSAITIGTAADTLVFIGASATDLLGCSPYFEASLPSTGNIGVMPVNNGSAISGATQFFSLIGTLTDHYHWFEWRVPMLVKKLRVHLWAGVTGSNSMYGRLYAMGTNALPGRLLYDFGTFVGTPLASGATAYLATGSSGGGIFLQPGEYYIDLMPAWTGSGTARLSVFQSSTGGPTQYNSGRLGVDTSRAITTALTATSGTAGAGPDPANVTSLDVYPQAVAGNQLFFSLSSS